MINTSAVNPLYNIRKEIRDKVIIDVNEIEGETITTLDDYLLKIYRHRRSCYQYVRDINRTIKLSELHEILCAEPGTELYDRLVKNDEAYKVIQYYAVRRKFYEKYQMHIDMLFFDNKHLMIPTIHAKAAETIMLNARHLFKHWRTAFEQKRLYSVKTRTWRIQKEVKEESTKFFSSLMKDIEFDSNLTIFHLHRQIYFMDNKLQLGVVIAFSRGGTYTIRPVVASGNNIRSKFSETIIVPKLMSRYSCLCKFILNLESKPLEIARYFGRLTEIQEKYSTEWNTMIATTYEMLNDFKNKNPESFISQNSIHLVSEFNNLVFVRKVSYKKHYNADLKVYKLVDGKQVLIMHLDSSAMYKTSTLKKAEHFLLDGFLNFYSREKDVDLESFFEVSNNAENFRFTFMRTTLTELREKVSLPYHEENHDMIVKTYEHYKNNKSIDIEKRFADYEKEFNEGRETPLDIRDQKLKTVNFKSFTERVFAEQHKKLYPAARLAYRNKINAYISSRQYAESLAIPIIFEESRPKIE